jgi:hypothetical protein
MMRIMGMFAAARFGTAGGAAMYLIRPGAVGSGGTANTPAAKRPAFPAAQTTASMTPPRSRRGLPPSSSRRSGSHRPAAWVGGSRSRSTTATSSHPLPPVRGWR